MWFLRNVAVMAESPDELGAACPPGMGARRRLGGRRQAPGQPPCRCRRCRRSTAEQVAGEAAAEARDRRFYDDGGFLSQPESLRRYLNAEMPDYLAPLRFLGVCDDLTDEFRLDEDGVSYVPPPAPDLPYFYAANARDPRAGIAHEGAHYQQLSLEQRPSQSGPAALLRLRGQRGDRLLQRGVPAAGRAVRRRPAHADRDLELRPPPGVARRGRRQSGHRGDEPRRRRRLLRPPGADGPPDGLRGVVLLRRQPRPRPVVPDGQAAADEPRRRRRRGRRRGLLVAPHPRRHLARRQRPVLAAAVAAARRSLGARRHRRRSGDGRAGAAAGVER